MDGTFACPECGTTVEVRGVAPGRQVRCEFCDRLLEVPFLPRAADGPWRRRRFARPKWIKWISAAGVALLVVILLIAGVGFVSRQYQSAQQRSIDQLIESARTHEANGRVDLALLDLDSALEVARSAGPSYHAHLERWQSRRGEIANLDAKHVLDMLQRATPNAFVLGNWLNLIARIERDPDIAGLRTTVANQFQAALGRQVDFEITAARQKLESEEVLQSLAHCDRVATLISHLADSRKASVRGEAESMVGRLVRSHGVNIEPLQGQFLHGSRSYVAETIPKLVKALETKHYLPYRESSPWRDQWKLARYHVNIEVIERWEGVYLTTSNRRTRIELNLAVSVSGQASPIFQTMPTAQSRMPLPRMPVAISSRVDLKGEQSADVEKLLYDDARSQVEERLARQLINLPACRSTGARP